MSLRNGEGQGLTEYALILVMVAVVVLLILSLIGPAVGNIFSNVLAESQKTHQKYFVASYCSETNSCFEITRVVGVEVSECPEEITLDDELFFLKENSCKFGFKPITKTEAR